jgi:hypothetical protein
MSRLLAFGCSYTWGAGLPDTFNALKKYKSGNKPSEFAWPTLLANKLGLDYLNLSQPGSGNKEILYKVINQTFLENDLVILYWSHFVRFDFFRASKEGGFRAQRNDLYFKTFIKSTDIITEDWKYDNAMQNYLAIKFVQMFLDQKKIKHYSLFTLPDFYTYDIPSYIDLNTTLKIKHNTFITDMSPDGMHFGVKSQENLAEELYNRIK